MIVLLPGRILVARIPVGIIVIGICIAIVILCGPSPNQVVDSLVLEEMINTLPSFCFLFIKGPLFLLKSGNGLKIRIIISFLTKINNLNAKRQKRKEKIKKNALT